MKKTDKKMKPVLVYLPQNFITKLHKLAGKKRLTTGKPISFGGVVREAIRKYLASK